MRDEVSTELAGLLEKSRRARATPALLPPKHGNTIGTMATNGNESAFNIGVAK